MSRTTREPEQILEQVSSWRPESLAAYERRRRANQPSPDAVAMAEAERMWAAELEREREAAKGGRPPKDGKTLKGTGVLRLPKGRALTKATPTPRAKRQAPPIQHGTLHAYYRHECRCEPCAQAHAKKLAARRANAARIKREAPERVAARREYDHAYYRARRAGQAGERAA